MIHTLRSRQNKSMSEFVGEALAGKGASAVFPISDVLAPDIKAVARVDHGRWLVDCPFCTNAVMLDPEEPRTYCLNCFNAAAGYAWVWVEVPDEATREAVEAALEGRPEHEQSWHPDTPVKHLTMAVPPPAAPAVHPDMLRELAHNAGVERDRQAGRSEALGAALTEERRHTLSLIHWIERLQREAEIRKALNVELQDQIDAFGQHGHEN